MPDTDDLTPRTTAYLAKIAEDPDNPQNYAGKLLVEAVQQCMAVGIHPDAIRAIVATVGHEAIYAAAERVARQTARN